MLRDLGHPAADGEPLYDITYENVQAGERTSHLFRLANYHGALVVGTGDLSELALGWSTYGVGDQMSHYNVNASVPEDADPVPDPLGDRHRRVRTPTRARCSARCSRPRSRPSWSPTDDPDADVPGQDSESIVGPYELQDFFLYYTAALRLPARARSRFSPITPGTTAAPVGGPT